MSKAVTGTKFMCVFNNTHKLPNNENIITSACICNAAVLLIIASGPHWNTSAVPSLGLLQ